MAPVCVEHPAPVLAPVSELSCPQRSRLARAGLLIAALAAGTAALTAGSSAAAAAEATVRAQAVVLPGPVAPGHAPLTGSAQEPRSSRPQHVGGRNPFGALVSSSSTADASPAGPPMTPQEAALIAPPAPPVSRSGRSPFLALVTTGAGAGAASPTDLPAATGDRVLAPGSTGEDVRDLQARLVATGIELPVDGSYGPRTAAAVAAFQRSRRIEVDGITGRQTWAVLRTP